MQPDIEDKLRKRFKDEFEKLLDSTNAKMDKAMAQMEELVVEQMANQ